MSKWYKPGLIYYFIICLNKYSCIHGGCLLVVDDRDERQHTGSLQARDRVRGEGREREGREANGRKYTKATQRIQNSHNTGNYTYHI